MLWRENTLSVFQGYLYRYLKRYSEQRQLVSARKLRRNISDPWELSPNCSGVRVGTYLQEGNMRIDSEGLVMLWVLIWVLDTWRFSICKASLSEVWNTSICMLYINKICLWKTKIKKKPKVIKEKLKYEKTIIFLEPQS